MANLYRKPVVKTDPETGERIKSHSKKWWGQFRDSTGRLRRHPLAVDKRAAQAMLNELVRKAELERAGLIDPTDEQRKRPIREHLNEFRDYMRAKGITEKQVTSVHSQIGRLIDGAKWKMIDDITVSSALAVLGGLRESGRSAQTFNNHLVAVKSFTRWLARDRRANSNPLEFIQRLNVETDRRHLRRALSSDEFDRLIKAATEGGRIEGICGPDRAMMYKLATWTGFRKSEIGSLTIRSLELDADPPTATVEAAFSKRRRRDTQILHPSIACELKTWIGTKGFTLSQPMFPVSDKLPGGVNRKTNKMIRLDLEAARIAWIEEVDGDAKEVAKREASDFLMYKDDASRVADFHACRHLFITRLQRANVSPKIAQTLARHSDIRLTMQVYTHVDQSEQVAAIGALKSV